MKTSPPSRSVPFKPYYIQRLRTPAPRGCQSPTYRLPAGTRPLDTYYARRTSDSDVQKKLRVEYAESIEVLNGLLRLDYMGSSEFEWGAFSDALTATVQQAAEMVPVSFEVRGAMEPALFEKPKKTKTQVVSLHGWARREHVEPLKVFIQREADYTDQRLKEPTYLRRSCFGRAGETKPDIVGWYDIGLYWFLTLDKNLADDVKQLLRVACQP